LLLNEEFCTHDKELWVLIIKDVCVTSLELNKLILKSAQNVLVIYLFIYLFRAIYNYT